MSSETPSHHMPSVFRESARSLGARVLGAALTGGVTLPARPMRRRSHDLSAVLSGKQVLISGASTGIGREVALKVARAGAVAVLVARSEAKLRELKTEIESCGGCARAYTADLSSAAGTVALLAQLARDHVQIDVLINNAGRSIRRPISQSYERVHDYERTMALNYFGALRLILGLLPGMRARKQGHIINVSSSGAQMGTPLFSAYIASKAALDAFTRVAASETCHDGVQFSTVHMPLVRTAMIAPTPAYQSSPALSPEQAADAVLRPLVTHEKQLGTRLARLFSLGHILAPRAMARLLNLGHRLSGQELG